MMNLDTVMTTDLMTVSQQDSLATVRTIMHDKRIHHVPVVNDEDTLVGLVTRAGAGRCEGVGRWIPCPGRSAISWKNVSDSSRKWVQD